MMGKCTCHDICNRRDFWRVGGINISRYGTVNAMVSCSRCGAQWETDAAYKTGLTGAGEYRDAFSKENDSIIRIAEQEIYELDRKIQALQFRKSGLEKRIRKRKDNFR